jgi:hypothetical protein
MNPDGTNVLKSPTRHLFLALIRIISIFLEYLWSQIIYPSFDKLYRINNDGSGLTKIYQTPNGKFISECDW